MEAQKDPRDAGFTLVELLVASLLLSLVLAIVAGIFISITATQRNVSALTTTTSTAQLAAAAIETGVRNASDVSAVLTPSGTDQYFVVRTASQGATITWSCRAWYYSAANGGSIRSTQTADGTKITAPTAAQLATWSLLATGITPRSGTGIFTGTSGGVTMAFNAVAAGDNKPIAIQTTVLKRTGVSEAGTCY